MFILAIHSLPMSGRVSANVTGLFVSGEGVQMRCDQSIST